MVRFAPRGPGIFVPSLLVLADRLTILQSMKPVAVLACLITLGFGGCSWFPRAGPSASEVVEQSRPDGEILFDVVEVDDRVVSTLRAQPKESFAARFTQDTQPALLNIAIGDTISVLIWESAAGGLFTEAPPALAPSGGRTGIEPLAPESPRQEPGAPAPPDQQRRARGLAGTMLLSEAAGRQAVQIPDQLVESDGAISVPYAGRIPAAGRLPAEVQQTIEARLADRALQPQALVIVKKSFANAVTVLLNETGAGRPVSLGGSSNRYLAGNPSGPAVAAAAAAAPVTSAAEAASTRVPLSPGGDRLLQIIATAGGAQAPVHETFVRLSRNGVTATIPLQQLVSEPAEDIYARPGDVLSLI